MNLSERERERERERDESLIPMPLHPPSHPPFIFHSLNTLWREFFIFSFSVRTLLLRSRCCQRCPWIAMTMSPFWGCNLSITKPSKSSWQKQASAILAGRRGRKRTTHSVFLSFVQRLMEHMPTRLCKKCVQRVSSISHHSKDATINQCFLNATDSRWQRHALFHCNNRATTIMISATVEGGGATKGQCKQKRGPWCRCVFLSLSRARTQHPLLLWWQQLRWTPGEKFMATLIATTSR